METAFRDSHYQRLTELIYDEDKIVTGTLLAKELKISKCDAQHLLKGFVKDTNREKSNDLHLTYVICGKLQNNKGVGVYLVEQNKLNDTRDLFDNISSEIVYSMQKGQHVDFNMIALTNSINENGSGPLVSKNSIKRTIKSRKVPLVQSSSGTSKDAATSSKNSKEITEKAHNTIPENGKHCSQSSQKQNKAKQGGIISFFAKTTSKSLQNGVKPASEHKTDSEQKVEAIAEQESVHSNGEKNGNAQIVCDEKMDIDDQDKDTKIVKDQSNGKKRKKESKNKGPSKKRKRIQEICDSDSSDMFDNDENEDIIEMSDDEPAPTPVSNPIRVPKNKKRKAVDKTYVDEEGFIVTTTEYIYETASEDEEKATLKPKPENKIDSQKKIPKVNLESKPAGNKGKGTKKPTNVKQPTLMSFFKKN